MGIIKDETKIQKKLKTLESELQKGQEMMTRLEQERANFHNNMMRISGAIRVLKEELSFEDEETCEKDNEELDTQKYVCAQYPMDFIHHNSFQCINHLILSTCRNIQKKDLSYEML